MHLLNLPCLLLAAGLLSRAQGQNQQEEPAPVEEEVTREITFEETLGYKINSENGAIVKRFLGEQPCKKTQERTCAEDYTNELQSLYDYVGSSGDGSRADYVRQKPTPTSELQLGTTNWKKLGGGSTATFTARNGHATTVYKCPTDNTKACLWLVGGRSDEYQGYDLEFSRRNADVWYSSTGDVWTQVEDLQGDYIDGIGNFNADFLSAKRVIAPWYSRYGHSLNSLDCNDDGVDDAMVMVGGFNPEPSNDIWISADGKTWVYDMEAPFTARAWHASAVFRGQLYIIGGAPLTNDVWTGNLTVKNGYDFDQMYSAASAYVNADDRSREIGRLGYNFTMVWKQKVKHMDVSSTVSLLLVYISGALLHFAVVQLTLPPLSFIPHPLEFASVRAHTHTHTRFSISPWLHQFSPRSGHCLMTQLRRDDFNSSFETYTDRMFLVGGFASWPKGDPRYDGERSRNDIYVTEDGKNWTKVLPPIDGETGARPISMPWAARAWHGCATLCNPLQRHRDVSEATQFHVEKYPDLGGDPNLLYHPRMFIMGGGYIGSKRNHVVKKMEAYVDLWSSRDGLSWERVSYSEGAGSALFTTQDWATTTVEDATMQIGKWGFTLDVFTREEDVNANGNIDEKSIEMDFAGNKIIEAEEAARQLYPPAPDNEVMFWRTFNGTERGIVSLIFIGGDTVDSGGLVKDVFISQPGILCEKEGVTCANKGACGPGNMGCVCRDREYIGEYCDIWNPDYESVAWSIGPGRVSIVATLSATLLFVFL